MFRQLLYREGGTMNLVRWNPFGELSLLQNQMNRLFDTAMQGWPEEANGTTGSWTPAADIYESDNELVVNVDLPGVHAETGDGRVENNVLSIRVSDTPTTNRTRRASIAWSDRTGHSRDRLRFPLPST